MIQFFIKRPKVVNLIMIFLFLAGAIGMNLVQTKGYPTVDFGVVNITTVYPGASPADVELKVTTKIEDELRGIDGIKKMTSMSIENRSQIQITLEDRSDYERVKQDIRDAVDNVQDFPIEVTSKPLISEVNNNRIPVVEIALYGNASESETRDYARRLEKQLQTNPLVGTISKLGYRKREIQINTDPQKLKKYYVSLQQVFTAVHARNIQESSGDLQINGIAKKVQLDETFKNITEIKSAIIRSGFDGNRIVLSDVAEVSDTFESVNKTYRFKGNDAINIVIFKKENADILETSDAIKEIVSQFKSQLPENIKLSYVIDYSNDARRLLTLVKNNALLGLILVLVTLVLFLNLRIAFWTALGIPTSIFFAFLIFPFVGITINFISLMGMIIVLGMLVDDAIVVAENIYRYKEQGLNGIDAAIKGTKEMLWPVVTTVITTIVAFAPLIAMTGTMGKFMWSMPVVVTFVLLGSLLECLFILPSHIAHSKMNHSRKPYHVFGKLIALYRKFVSKTLKHPILTIAAFIFIFISSMIVLINKLDFVLFDSRDGMYGYIKYELPIGTPLEITAQKTTEIEAIIDSMPENEILTYVTTIGEKVPPISSYGQDSDHESLGNIVLHLSPISNRNRSASVIMKDLHDRLQQLDGIKHIEAERIPEGPPIGRAITLTIISNNNAHRSTVINQAKSFLTAIPSVYNLEDNQGIGKKKLEIKLNHSLVSRLGLTTQQIAETLRIAFDGAIATTMRRNGEEVDYRIQLAPNYRRSLEIVKQLEIINNKGKLIRIGQLLTIVETDDVLQVMHYDGDRATTLYGDIDPNNTETDLTTALKVNNALLKEIKPIVAQYPGMRLEMGGEEKDTQEAMQSLFVAMGLALIGIYFILVILFDSFTQPFLVMIAIPFTFSGIIFTFLAHKMVFGFMAILGLIGLTGIVVNDALILISMINLNVKEKGLSIEVIAEAASYRLRPILLTTITTAAGLMPTAYGFGGDNPFLTPMIMAIAWGLIFATIITLVLVPAMYWLQCLFFVKWGITPKEKVECQIN